MIIIMIVSILSVIIKNINTETFIEDDLDLGRITTTFNSIFVEEAAFVKSDKIILGEKVCFNEMFKNYNDVSNIDNCIKQIKFDFILNNKVKKILTSTFSKPKCSKTISYTKCWTPKDVGSWQIVSRYINQNNDVIETQSDTKSYFVVTKTNCVSHSYSSCYNNNIHWFNACGEVEDVIKLCLDGCNSGECNAINTKNTLKECEDI